jgi:hypothetical protein
MAKKWGAEKWSSPQAFRHFFAPHFFAYFFWFRPKARPSYSPPKFVSPCLDVADKPRS